MTLLHSNLLWRYQSRLLSPTVRDFFLVWWLFHHTSSSPLYGNLQAITLFYFKNPFSTSLSYGSAVLVLPFYVSSYNLPTYIPCGNIKCSNIHLYTLCLGPVATVLHSHIHDTENLACTKQLLRRQEPHDAADHIYPTSFQYNLAWRLHLTYCGSAVLHVPD